MNYISTCVHTQLSDHCAVEFYVFIPHGGTRVFLLIHLWTSIVLRSRVWLDDDDEDDEAFFLSSISYS